MQIGNKFRFPEVFQKDEYPFGVSYEVWTQKWWQWAMSVPKNKNPILDSTGQYCSEMQHGRVWFLAGTTGHVCIANRHCSIPHTKCILFPIIVSEYSLAEVPNISSKEQLVRRASKDISQTTLLEVIIDGYCLPNLKSNRIRSKYFQLNLIRDNIWNLKAGPTWAASDGFWIFFKPLDRGNHKLTFRGAEPHFKNNVTYYITSI